jgi:beta-galactosidase
MIRSSRLLESAILLAVLLGGPAAARSNDAMFSSEPAAKPAIDVDGKGFIINGQRTYVASGSIHYPRVPHELWRDRLLRARRASFNTVETYAFWNFHEPRENEWKFSGDGDLEAFLETAQDLGMYAIVRAGPYVCAEWDFGGYPIWIKFKPGVEVRKDNPAFLALNDHWYEKILPMTAAHQIHKGGNVILVQLENEHRLGWGAVTSPSYFKHLYDVGKKQGIEVPFFMSGLNHGHGPHPTKLDNSNRTTPWFTTEFWPGWFNIYGDLSDRRFREVERDHWRIVAGGGNGQNFYMLHGGSNFETWNDPSGAASYDYGAAIGQAGDLRPIYYRMKRTNQFATSFGAIFSNSTEASAEYQDFATGARMIGARKSPAGTVVFLSGAGLDSLATLKSGATVRLAAGETAPIVLDAPLSDGVRIVESAARILGLARNEGTTNVVVYGQPEDVGRIRLSIDQPAAVSKSAAFIVDGATAKDVTITVKFPAVGPEVCELTVGARMVRVIAVSVRLAYRTWIVDADKQQFVVCGPEFVGDFGNAGGKPLLTIERPYGQSSCGKVVVFGDKGAPLHLAVKSDATMDSQPAPALENWQMRLAEESKADFDDSKWKVGEEPQQMGTDGDTSAFAWYRATVQVPQAGSGTLEYTGADTVIWFVNGARVMGKSADFKAGANVLAAFTSHRGRDKAFGHMGAVAQFANKGLSGPVKLKMGKKEIPIKGWKMRGGVGAAESGTWLATGATKGVPAFYRAAFTTRLPGTGAYPILRATVQGLSRGTMWLNGHNLGRYPEKIRVDGLYLPECWLKDGANTLIVFDEEGNSNKPVKLYVESAASREVIRVSEPCDPALPIVLPAEPKQASAAVLNKGNLAFGKSATASSSEPGRIPGNATDGNLETRWSADSIELPQWWQVDLGQVRQLSSCHIARDREDKVYQFILEGSADAQRWTMLSDQRQSNWEEEWQTLRLAPPTAVRYLRITITGLSPKVRASISEVRVIGK